ncbi:MAG: DUF2339 domain-containing protein [Flavobacteriales bacterium]|nr:DUF2339 domain-containing protein [Flavobacteriales bacterium]MCB9448345.1 DUF2339 domain-containing protein [Flavobacteriales bacterium]
MDHTHDIQRLQQRLDALQLQQEQHAREIREIRGLLDQLKKEPEPVPQERVEIPHVPELVEAVRASSTPSAQEPIKQPHIPADAGGPKRPKANRVRGDIEKFIGENLISKIGIIITIFGVAIGSKYAIDHDLVSPATRITLGYVIGATLMFFALRLKKKYTAYSAVLLSGAMAIFYFVTYAAYNFYGMMPKEATFGIMLLFTIFTVAAALRYDQQVIAHIGLVGAYAVPFLLSDGSGRVEVLFSYMTLINTGIAVIAFRKYWKPLYVVAYALTWLIYSSWFVLKFNSEEHFKIGAIFVTLFFVIFYITFLAYKLVKQERFLKSDVVMLLSNAFLFYAWGYALLDDHPVGKDLLGVFTVANALLHAAVSLVIYRRRLADRNLFYLMAGLGLVFLTIAIPVQLDGSWVTLLWAGEAALLFRIGRGRKEVIYESLSYPLMGIAFLSMLQDWSYMYDGYDPEITDSYIRPIFNVHFLSQVLFAGAFGWIFATQRKHPESRSKSMAVEMFTYMVPVIMLLTIYITFWKEIDCYWDQTEKSLDSLGALFHQVFGGASSDTGPDPIEHLRFISLSVYSMLFMVILSLVGMRKRLPQTFSIFVFLLGGFSVLAFLTGGLFSLSILREIYLVDGEPITVVYLARYVSLSVVALTLWIFHRTVSDPDLLPGKFRVPYGMVVHGSALWIASSELIQWMDLAGYAGSYKLGLSILWGIYALFLVVMGISRRKKHLRIAGIAWFAVTLVKLFFYDIAHLNTISKTIVFVSLGVLLLVVSFLYNKYRHVIEEEDGVRHS